ncbi:IclR family transcriptional regulator [Burkholderia multivorans]|uniref:IclR family transcriptional regulator n=1 Tax=Burkholderia multivorans TaxID=87883 RepID=UPI000CFFCF76|nr:IclR family transcriptional regulator [Burkholderia multivorans]MBU9652767.1 IclR family transcriptional regulator [Burkholderia multivorans]MDN7450871.1 IclR family transcriptional regulator [Burkholderia multivorans]PRG59743.1 IclR family transcriptional regulator [Burkholderia multivorans]
MSTTAADSTLFVQSFATGLAVLDAFDNERPSMNLPEIAAAVGITKSAAQRFAFTLEALGLLRKDPVSRRYSLAPRALHLGYRYLQAHSLLERANPYLADLNRDISETVNLSEPDGNQMVYIGRFPNPARAIVYMPVGRTLPMFCSSSGRAYLSGLSDDEVLEILKTSDLVKYTKNTVIEIDAIMQMIVQARETGYAYTVEEYYRGDLAIAAPLFGPGGVPVGAVNISASVAHWTLERAIAELVPHLFETARLISTTPPSRHALEPFRVGYGKTEKRRKS